jgi:hypothetical protein
MVGGRFLGIYGNRRHPTIEPAGRARGKEDKKLCGGIPTYNTNYSYSRGDAEFAEKFNESWKTIVLGVWLIA